MTDPAAEIWTRIQGELRGVVSDTTFELWLTPLRAASYEGDVLLVEAPGPTRGWVADRFSDALDEAARRVLGPRARVEIAGEGRPKPADAARPSRGGGV